jgi:hypothetical protein
MTRTLRLCLALAATALVFAIPSGATATADGPTASASRNCRLHGNEGQTDYPPASYVTSIRVFNTTCRKGKSVTKAYHRCRRAHGGANGRCPNRVQRFRCREGARESVPGVQYSARVVCRRGSHKIVSTYTQNV